MMKKIILILLLPLFIFYGYSQNERDTTFINAQLRIYAKKGLWEKLISESDRLYYEDNYLSNFYFGVANFEMQHYFDAMKLFERAYALNDMDTSLQRYFFYTYIKLGLYNYADRVYQQIKDSGNVLPNYQRHLIQNASFEFQYTNNYSFFKEGNQNFLTSQDVSGQMPVIRDANFQNVNLLSFTGKGTSIIQNFSLFDITRMMTYRDTDNISQIYLRSSQKSYGLKVNFPLKKQWLATYYIGFKFGYYEDYNTMYYPIYHWKGVTRHSQDNMIMGAGIKKLGSFYDNETKCLFSDYIVQTFVLEDKFSLFLIPNRKLLLTTDIQFGNEFDEMIKTIEILGSLKRWQFRVSYSEGDIDKMISLSSPMHLIFPEEINFCLNAEIKFNFNSFSFSAQYYYRDVSSSYSTKNISGEQQTKTLKQYLSSIGLKGIYYF